MYLGALITIIATAGDSARAVLPDIQPKSRKLEQDVDGMSRELSLVLDRQWRRENDSSK